MMSFEIVFNNSAFDGRGVLVEEFDENVYAAELHRLLQDRQGREQRRALYPAYVSQFGCGTIGGM